MSNLISRAVIEQMGLVKKVHTFTNGSKFGLLKTQPVKIVLRDDAEPYAVHTARRVPIPLIEPVKEELNRMERHHGKGERAHRMVRTDGAGSKEKWQATHLCGP